MSDLIFQLNGGWFGLVTNLFIHSIKWICIGFLIHLGWNIL